MLGRFSPERRVSPAGAAPTGAPPGVSQPRGLTRPQPLMATVPMPTGPASNNTAKVANISTRLPGIMSGPVARRGALQARQMANRRGLLNSSMAVGAANAALLDRSLQIAQADANVGTSNADRTSREALTREGYRSQEGMQAERLDHDKSEAVLDRAHEAGWRGADRTSREALTREGHDVQQSGIDTAAATQRRGQDISALTARRGQDVQQSGIDTAAATARRGQDVQQSGIDRAAATARRGQDISAATARRGQDVQQSGIDTAAATQRRGQDIGAATAKSAQAVQLSGILNSAVTARRGQDISAQISREQIASNEAMREADREISKYNIDASSANSIRGVFAAMYSSIIGNANLTPETREQQIQQLTRWFSDSMKIINEQGGNLGDLWPG